MPLALSNSTSFCANLISLAAYSLVKRLLRAFWLASSFFALFKSAFLSERAEINSASRFLSSLASDTRSAFTCFNKNLH